LGTAPTNEHVQQDTFLKWAPLHTHVVGAAQLWPLSARYREWGVQEEVCICRTHEV